MKKTVLILFIAVLAAQCSTETGKTGKEKPTVRELKDRITEMNDSLDKLYKALMDDPTKKIPSLAIYETVDRYLNFYKNYPEDSYSAECLDKVQQLFLQEKVYDKSLQYSDTLLEKYPDYPKKAMVLLNAGSTSDVIGDTAKVRKYYSTLLTDFPKLDQDTKEMVEFRIKHLDLTFDQLIELQMKNMASKK